MNYYEHHLGDYMRDTAHLSLLEDGTYRRLLDAYYIRERALPADLRECCKLARATTKAEREAVAYVLREFFTLTEDGHQNKRAASEVARFKAKSDKARASVAKRWERIKNADTDDQRTEYERITTVSPEDIRTYNDGNTPRARPQSPVTNPSSKATSVDVASKPRPTKKAPADFSLSDEMKAWASEHAPSVDAAQELEKLKDHTFANARSDWPGTFRNWLRKAEEDAARNAARVVGRGPANTPCMDAERTAQMLAEQRMTPEQREAANEARRRVMSAVRVAQ